MFQFFFQRVLVSRSMLFTLMFGLFLSLFHVWQEMVPNLRWLELGINKGYGIDFTPYSQWFEFGGSTITFLFFITLPILSSLPFADTFAKDRETRYFHSIFSKGKINEYFRGLYITNFFVAGIVAVIPLLVNIYFAFMLFPDIVPDSIINHRMSLDDRSSLFPEFYYSHPFLHMLFYVLLAFLYAGMYATVSIGISFFVKNRFLLLVSVFLIQMVITLIFQSLNMYGWVPSIFLREFGNVSKAAPFVLFFSGMFLGTGLYIWGVKKRVVF